MNVWTYNMLMGTDADASVGKCSKVYRYCIVNLIILLAKIRLSVIGWKGQVEVWENQYCVRCFSGVGDSGRGREEE